MEIELLSIVMVLGQSHSMLLGAECFIFTNHKNLTFANLNCCCVLILCLFVKEYGLTILYYLSKKNVIEDKSFTFLFVMCCRRMDLLFSLTLLLKAPTSAITPIYLNSS